jgi:opacity protein-like surface antigen
MQMKRLAVVAVLLAMLIMASVAAAAGTLSGTYQAKIGAQPLGGKLKGTWTIKFSHGNYKVSDNGTAVVKGKYTISGAKVTLGHESGPAACPGSGTYTFKLSGKKLTFTRVNDGTAACAGRATVLAGHFTKIG